MPTPPCEVVLHAGRDRSVRRRHPWVLSGAVDRVAPDPAPAGAWARVRSAEGEVLGYGHYSPASSLRVRLLHFGKEDPGDDALLGQRIAAAVRRRAGAPALADTDAVRLINAEGDGLPGLIVDRYADVAVARLTTAGMDVRRDAVAAALQRETGCRAGFERPDAAASRREGLAARPGPLWGDAPTAPVAIVERDRRFGVDVAGGQKTGFYLDQREHRDRVASLAAGRRVLDLFSYTGGFAVAAARGGAAEVVAVDSSRPALERAAEHLRANAPACRAALHAQDAFEWLRRGDEAFDLLVLDPPPLARHRRDVSRASRALKDLVLHALRRSAPDAHLLCFACSHHVDAPLLRKIVFGASLDAGRSLRVLGELGAPADHPVSLDHPEGAYLTGLWVQAE